MRYFATISVAFLTLLSQLTAQNPRMSPQENDPLYQRKGDQKRTYNFPGTGEAVPYRTFVPSSWSPNRKMPLVVVLHGGGLDENAPFEGAPANLAGILAKEAESHGFIVAAPFGYDKAGMWGSSFGYAPAPGTTAPKPPLGPEEMVKVNARSEQDVLNVLEIVANEYGVDRSRVFLMGNSRGSMGTLHLAQKHPNLWLAIGPSDGPIAEASTYPYGKLKIKGAIFVHGSLDKVPIEVNREIARHVKERGIITEFVEVPGGEHGTSWYMALPRIFDFFAGFPRD